MSDISTENELPFEKLIESVPDGVKCMFCRYNLRMLPINSRCPECGESIVKTFELAAARRNRPPWTIHGKIFILILLAQLASVAWQVIAAPLGRPGRTLFDPSGGFIIVAICCVYLILRTRPRLQESRSRIILKYVFLAVLTFFWFALTHLYLFDQPFMRLIKSLGWS